MRWGMEGGSDEAKGTANLWWGNFVVEQIGVSL